MDVVKDKLSESPEEQESWRKSVVMSSLRWLVSSYSRSKQQPEPPCSQEQNILGRLLKHLVTASESILLSCVQYILYGKLVQKYKKVMSPVADITWHPL